MSRLCDLRSHAVANRFIDIKITKSIVSQSAVESTPSTTIRESKSEKMLPFAQIVNHFPSNNIFAGLRLAFSIRSILHCRYETVFFFWLCVAAVIHRIFIEIFVNELYCFIPGQLNIVKMDERTHLARPAYARMWMVVCCSKITNEN